jgi:endonuclease/exonuclease/phosphatase family metal-dependent hydrolase
LLSQRAVDRAAERDCESRREYLRLDHCYFQRPARAEKTTRASAWQLRLLARGAPAFPVEPAA